MPEARWAGPADKGGIERLFMEYLALQNEPEDRIGFAKTWREALRPTSKFRFSVVNGDDGVLAFATVHDTYSTHANAPAVRVEDLYVDPEHAGLGHRQTLVGFAEDYARRQKAKYVDVFLQAETAVDPDFLPRGFEPLPSPPFRKRLDAKANTGTPRPTRRGEHRTTKRDGHVPTGRRLANLFQ